VKFLDALLCFLFGHEEPRRLDHDGFLTRLPESEPWPCTRCGDDARPCWVIQLDTEDRLERIYLALRDRKP
jgi:hypothetical protein